IDLRRGQRSARVVIRLTLVIQSLGGGGAERVMATLANAWAAEGAAVTLITLADRDGDKYQLHAAVKRVALGVAGRSPHVFTALRNNVVRLRSQRSAMPSSASPPRSTCSSCLPRVDGACRSSSRSGRLSVRNHRAGCGGWFIERYTVALPRSWRRRAAVRMIWKRGWAARSW